MHYRQAIVRQPGRNFASGLTTANLGAPDYDKAFEQHTNYCRALESCGIQVTVLPTLPDYPDCPFVEDVAIITDSCAVITIPGDKSRQGEGRAIESILSQSMPLEYIKAPGTVDGGDVLRIHDSFFIGLSQRTNAEGTRQLSAILEKHGYITHLVPVKNILHLQTGITYIGNNNIVAIHQFASLPEFEHFHTIEVSEEAYAANCLYLGDTLLIPQGYPQTLKAIKTLGYNALELEMTEFQKMDGGLTCLSLLY